MPTITRHLTSIAGAGLLATVVTQVLYLVLEASGTPLGLTLWRVEAAAFVMVALAGGALISGRPLVGAGLAIGGVFNVIQAGMGLTMFGPLRGAGEAMAPAMQAVLGIAFFLYFAGKVAFAWAAIALGTSQFAAGAGTMRGVGGLAVLTGAAAFLINMLAMVTGMQFTFYAGAAGTAAALFLALALFMARGRKAP